MLLARARAAALRPGALRSLSQQGQSGRIFAARVAGAHRPQSLVRHRSSGIDTIQSVLRHLSTATTDDGQGTHPRDGRPSLFSKKTVDFAAVLEEYEHPTPARISQKNQRRRFSAARRPRITRAVDATPRPRAQANLVMRHWRSWRR